MQDSTTHRPSITASEQRRLRLAHNLFYPVAPLVRFLFPKYWKESSPWVLHGAAYIGDATLLTRWLKMGVPCDARESIGQSTPLMTAAAYGHISIIELLLQAGADIQAKSEHGDTALIHAAEHGQDDVVRFLLDRGVDMDAVESGFGHTALFKAASEGHLPTVQLLVEHGANPWIRMRANVSVVEWTRLTAGMFDARRAERLACAEYLEGLSPA